MVVFPHAVNAIISTLIYNFDLDLNTIIINCKSQSDSLLIWIQPVWIILLLRLIVLSKQI